VPSSEGVLDAGRRVLRGGSFLVPTSLVRSGNRYGNLPDYRLGFSGFRVARTCNAAPLTPDHLRHGVLHGVRQVRPSLQCAGLPGQRLQWPERNMTKYSKKPLVWQSRASRIALLIGFISLFTLSAFAAERWEPGQTHAVIVGVCKWKADLTRYSRRHRKDKELRDLLIQRGTPTENITILLDSEATLSNIRKAIEDTLRKTTEESTLIVYYAGHGWKADNDFCFANYDVRLGPQNRKTVWSMNELAISVTDGFNGQQAIFWADCCYSGGMQVVVEKLATRKVASFSLTSAATANTSTGNWTFTQSILDGLAGEPLIDTNNDGEITLGELQTEVKNAMHHLEGQANGFYSDGTDDSFVIAETSGEVVTAAKARYPIGSYVRATGRYGRVVAVGGDDASAYSVQFYNYTDKVVKTYAEADLVASTRKPHRRVARVKPDCKVEWRGRWYDAKVLQAEKDQWLIHYVDDDDSWDEWVGKERIRFKQGASDNK